MKTKKPLVEMDIIDSELLSLEIALYQNTLNSDDLIQEYYTIPFISFLSEVRK